MKQIINNTDIEEIDFRKIDLNLLTVFAALMRENNVTRAAKRLGLSQSAVSSALGRLRALYDDPLLTRTQAGMKPTARAVTLYPRILAALDAIGQTFDTGTPDPDHAFPPLLRLGLSDDYELAFGPALAKAFRHHAPKSRLVFHQVNSRLAAKALVDGQVDLTLTGGGLTGSQVKRLALGRSDYACLIDPASRSEQHSVSLEEYLARPHILVSYDGLTGAVDDVLQERKLKRTIALSTSHYGALSYLLAGTGAIATIPRHVAKAIAGQTGLAMIACPLSLSDYSVDLGWHFASARASGILRARDLFAGIVSDGLTA
ncbi:LysR family transcriptional regulator [Aestuariispira insulae]|uniref:LysR family transcriptional regulator n=1 Tax=Aestuariispira insulae TaxID=1461337 RepID=A0A3D9HWM4_9PROT|nr:LysR family transcriptional regulator [Aestuariispira insulae]RED53781.1 LysR family transcriptional regulator [Aestuariispira insulae]